MLGGADNPNGELPSYITGANIQRLGRRYSGKQQSERQKVLFHNNSVQE